MPISQLRSRF